MATTNDSDINIIIKYSTEGEEAVQDAQKQTEDLGKKAKSQKEDFSALNNIQKLNLSSMKALGSSAISLASKLGVAGIAIGTTYKLFSSVVTMVNKYAQENERLRSSYATLTQAINTQSGALATSEDVQSRVKKTSDTLRITQERINAVLEVGIEKTHNFDMAMQAVKDAYDLATAGVGEFEDNYNNLIAAYTGDLQVWDNETNAALQAGIKAYNTYYEQVLAGADSTYGEILRKEMEFQYNNDSVTKRVAENFQELKQIALGEVNDIYELWRQKDWAELINRLIIDPINTALRLVVKAAEWVAGLPIINWLFGTNLNLNGIKDIMQIPKLQSQQSEGTPVNSFVAGALDAATGGALTTATNIINLTVEGSVWTTKDLVAEIGNLLFEQIKLRGAR